MTPVAINDSPINRFAAGLLGLLDIKAMGKTPARLADQVVPMIDLDPYYRAENRIVVSYTEAAVIAWGEFQGGASVTVPQNSIWLLENIRLRFGGAPAGSQIAAIPLIFNSGGVVAWAGERTALLSNTATLVQRSWQVGYTFDKPFVMLPSWRLGLAVCSAEALGAGVDVRVDGTVSPVAF